MAHFHPLREEMARPACVRDFSDEEKCLVSEDFWRRLRENSYRCGGKVGGVVLLKRRKKSRFHCYPFHLVWRNYRRNIVSRLFFGGHRMFVVSARRRSCREKGGWGRR